MVRSLGRGTVGIGRWWLWLGATTVTSALPSLAHAQAGARPNAAQPLLSNRDPAIEPIMLGRMRMAKGDCAGALEAFDAAVRTSVDPSVRRDRGLCHEQLGHPFPAIDDFRVYLTAMPDAPDAEDVRTRLNQLEIANGLGGTGTGGTTAGAGTSPGGKVANHEDPFAVDASGKGVQVVAGSGDRSRVGNYDAELVQNSRWDEAEASPLRRGSGLGFGAYGRGYGATGNGYTGYGVGATLRGSLSQVSTLYGEVGYVTYRAGADNDIGVRAGGVSMGLGYEARIRLDQFASNAIILAGILSYERLTDRNSSVDGTSEPITNLFNPRVKVGYRHVFGPGFGLEIAGEVAQPVDLASGTSPETYFGGTLALLVGF